MKRPFSIGSKIGLGFGTVLLLVMVVMLITNSTLRKSREINHSINDVYNPSVASLEKLRSSILLTRMLITNWAFVQSREDTQEKLNLIQITERDIPKIKREIDSLSVNWQPSQVEQKIKIYKELNTLLEMYELVKANLPDMRSYDNPYAQFMIRDYAEDGGEIDNQTTLVMQELSALTNSQRALMESDGISMIRSFDKLEGYLRNFGILLVLGGAVIAVLTVRSIVVPVNGLRNVILALSKGKIPEHIGIKSNDEVGEMATALEGLVQGLRRTAAFSAEVGKGNFDYEYHPLGEDDVLGHALLVMRDDLRENALFLEEKVKHRTEEVVAQKDQIEKQNRRLVELYKNITDSIRYAKRLQDNILPSISRIKEIFPNSFVFFRPRDIVSGDFYFFQVIDNRVVFAAVDCTGHGVPGAFMSLMGYNNLVQVVNESDALLPGLMLEELSKLAFKTLNKNSDTSTMRDSMDIALCVLDMETRVLQYAGAYCPLYIISATGELKITKANHLPIGSREHINSTYDTHTIQLKEDDTIYLFSDGYVDQFGGEDNKKFMYSRFRELLLKIYHLSPQQQAESLQTALLNWRGEHEQIDDILVMGIRV